MSKKENKARERARAGTGKGRSRERSARERRKHETDEENSSFKAWWVTWTITAICFAMAAVFYFEEMQAMASFNIDLGNITNIWQGIFGSIFGTIGAITGIAAVYGEIMVIFLWAGIGMAILSIVLTIVQRPKEK